MSFQPTRVICPVMGAVVGLSVLALSTSTALAGAVPDVVMSIQVSDAFDSTFNPAGSDLGGGLFGYEGGIESSSWTIDWDFIADDSIAEGALLGTGFEVSNLSGGALEFSILVTLPLSSGIGGETTYLGSGGLTLGGVDGDLGVVRDSIWQAQIDGLGVAMLFSEGLSFSGADAVSADESIAVSTTGSTTGTIGVLLSFSLSAGDTMTATGAFGVIPAPSALAVLGLGAMFGRRRRR